MDFVIRNAELFQLGRREWQAADVVVSRGQINRILPASSKLSFTGRKTNSKLDMAHSKLDIADEIEAAGCALLMGLHDHHIHLLSLAESLRSLKVGPPEVATREEFYQAFLSPKAGLASGKDWIRAVGYHESVAGELDQEALDAIASNHPIRVQHSSGAMWMFNSLAMELLGLTQDTSGAEVGADGKPTGRFFGSDEFLRLDALEQTGAANRIGQVGALLAGFGVTGITDATPEYGAEEVAFFSQAVSGGELPQRLTLMVPEGSEHVNPGPYKIILSDHSLPSFDHLAEKISSAHGSGRSAAVHSVTRASLALLVAVLDEVGSVAGDRVEHASVVPPELMEGLLRHNVRVVTQPNFVAERGDRYLAEVESDDIDWLYRCRGLQEAGLRVAGSTDAPFGSPNPWQAIWAAVTRRTQFGGVVLGAAERVKSEQALALFLSHLDDPGGVPRQVKPGEPADLCLLEAPWREVAAAMPENPVRATWVGGEWVV